MLNHHGSYNHNEKNHHDHKADRVVARVEKSVHFIVGHSQTQKQAGSMENEHNQMDYKGTSTDAAETKPKLTTIMKIPKWKDYDLENKFDRKENNHEHPTMIDSGGWVRPNRAMWASSPPSSSNSKPLKNT
ncbi:unnamed protein product [Microthlaspi erraticum]|uniref:Uncharacterized protein n=1 Tax=Microthlaspi erraticum TaxID=1685480 RepID=A0A6D2KWI2_9BRAS|nr:unnamed protein product [Microthlaspi erraticum]